MSETTSTNFGGFAYDVSTNKYFIRIPFVEGYLEAERSNEKDGEIQEKITAIMNDTLENIKKKGFECQSSGQLVKYFDYNVGDKVGDKEIEEIYFQDPTSHVIYRLKGSCGVNFQASVWQSSQKPSPGNDLFNETLNLIPESERKPYLGSFAHALHEAYIGNIKTSEQILKNIKKIYNEAKSKSLRLKYLTHSSKTMGCGIIFILAIWIILHQLQIEIATVIPLSIIAAAIGGFVSVAISLDKFKADPYLSESYVEHIADSRMVTAMVSGLIVLLSIRSNFAFGFMNSSTEAICLATFVGGFSEKILVHIVNKVENKEVKMKDEPPAQPKKGS